MQAGGAGPRRSPTRSEPPRCAPSPCLRPFLGRFQPPGILSALLTPVSLEARGRRQLTWSAYPRRFAADVFKKFRHGRKDFGSGRSPRAAEKLSVARTAAPKLPREPKLKALSGGPEPGALPAARPSPPAAATAPHGAAPGAARGRAAPGGSGLLPPGRARVSPPISSPPPSRPTTAERRRIGPRPDSPTFVSNSRSRRRRAEARRGPGDFTPASAPAPLTDTARRQRSGVELGKLSAETGNNKRGARPRPPPPQPLGPEPPGSAAPPAAAEGPGPRGRQVRSAELPPAAAPLPPPPPPEGSRPGGRPIPGRSEAAGPVIGEWKAGSRRRARRSGGRRRREARGTEVGAALTGQASPAASCGPRTITKLCPKWLPGPARPGAGGGGACVRGGRGREAEGPRPLGSAGGHAERTPTPGARRPEQG